MTRIDRLGSDDFAAWAPLWAGYLDFYRASVDAPTSRLTFERLVGGREPMGGFIARDDAGRPVGLTHWIDHRSCWTSGDYCYLQDLFVAPTQRGGGTGRKLIDAVTAAAKTRGCSRVHWLTHETNADAMKLYEKVAERSGFVQYRILLN